MSFRIIVGLVLTATLSGCFDGSSGSSTAASGTAATTATAATSTASGSITSTASVSDTTVTPIMLSGVPAASVTAGSAYSFTPTVSAATGVVTYAVSGLPSWATFDSSTGTLSGTPSTAAVGTTGNITITATDGTSSGSVGPFVIRINPETPVTAAAPPVISGTPGTAITSGQTYAFLPVASDAAGNALTFAITNCPAWATFSTATGMLSGVPTAAQAGTYTNITITVSDGTLSAALPAFTIVVTAASPDMPAISGTPAVTVVAGQAYAFQPTASDPAGKALTYSITNPPVWATFSTTTGKLSGTPGATQVGPYAGIVISADNGTQMTSLPAFTIQVTAAPAPDAPTIAGTAGSTVTAGQAYSFTPTASDPEGKTLTFSIANRPDWATFNAATGTLSGTPTTAQAGSYPGIAITVTNGSATASLTAFGITVTVPAPPASPTISGSPATTVVAGAAYSFTPTTTDPSHGTLTFSITHAPSWATFDAATGQLSGTPSAANVGASTAITISVSDGTTSATLPAFTITVTAAPVTNGSANLSWTAPTTNIDGTPLTNLSGYVIYYGNSATSMTQSVQITDPATTSTVISGLTSGTWYFDIEAVNSANVESPASAVASKTI
jgi:hypothetical protein